jgi:sugar/nucleoside kinase (ribokinase family)
MLCCIGDLVEDVVVWLSEEPVTGTDTPAQVFRRRGGSAANVASLAVEAGGRSRFIGQVGDDRLGLQLTDQLEAAGVDVWVENSGRTGTVVILVDRSAERTMLPDRGASTELDYVAEGALDDVAWLHVPGYSLIAEPLGSTTRDLIERAHQRSIPVSIDASSTGLVEAFGTTQFVRLIEQLHPSILFCNSDEATLLKLGPERPARRVGLTVLKAGAGPTRLIGADGSTDIVPVNSVGAVIDTTGAGDAFAAGYLVATLDNKTPIEAAQAAHRLAATVLSRPGAASR